jgi:hypothetical protein
MVLEDAVMVTVLDPDPGAGKVTGVKDAVTPAGRPVIDNATAELNPPVTAVVAVTVPCPPGVRLRDDDVDKVNEGLDGLVGGALASVQWFTSRNASGEPRPVAWL